MYSGFERTVCLAAAAGYQLCTRRMCSDIACGAERSAVRCINTVDDEPYPTGFTYIAHSDVQLRLTSTDGCHCTGRYVGGPFTVSCACNAMPMNTVPPHLLACRCTAATCCSCEAHGQLECGSACQCAADCGRRASQQGLAVPVQLRKGAKGWGVYAAEPVSKGAFVASYTGEHLKR